MRLKKIIIGSLIGGFIYFLLDWLAYSIFLNGVLERHPGLITDGLRDESIVPAIVFGKLLSGFLLAYLLINSKTQTIPGGIKKGGTFGFLISCSTNWIVYGNTTVYSKTFIISDIIVFTLISAIAAYAIIILADLDDKSLSSSTTSDKRRRRK